MRESSVFRDSREAEDTGLEHIKYQNEYQPRASEAKAPGRGTSFFFFLPLCGADEVFLVFHPCPRWGTGVSRTLG